MPTLQEYITRIKAGEHLEEINLYKKNLTNKDVEQLMDALKGSKTALTLKKLNLYKNKITSIIIPKELVALEWLDLQYNQLTSINIPKELVALQGLDLGTNQLTSINIPKELAALKELFLNNNQLTSINIPKELVALEWLHLNNNLLTPAFIATLRIFCYLNDDISIDVINSEASLTTESLTQHFSTTPSGRSSKDAQKNRLLQLLNQAVIAAQLAKRENIPIAVSAKIIGTDLADLIPTENPAVTLEYMRSMFSWEQDKINRLPQEAETFISTGLETIINFEEQHSELLKKQQNRYDNYSFINFFGTLCENIAAIIESVDKTVKKEKLNQIIELFGDLRFNIKVLQAQDYLDALKPALIAKKREDYAPSPKGLTP